MPMWWIVKFVRYEDDDAITQDPLHMGDDIIALNVVCA
jgi:hypothetical protein